jgi:4-hydroxybenzoyl-CoA reductase subunit beta
MTMRLPSFEYVSPTTLEDATRILADAAATVVGGGTDLFPKMKRRQLTPETLVSLSQIQMLKGIRVGGDGSCAVGAGTTLAELAACPDVPSVLASAAGEIASPQIRNTATVGGNLCLDTRCNYIDMPELWREASGHCLKDGGEICWVAPRSDHCWAISSSDLAPVAVAMGASVRLTSEAGDRVIPVEDFYRNDGIDYHAKAADEILTELVLPAFEGRATYRKLRRRGSIDFPLVGVAAAGVFDDAGICVDVRLVIGAVASAPLRAPEAEEFLVGNTFTEEVIEEAARLASHPVRPQDNTDTGSRYRKWMTPVYVTRALRDLAVDDARRTQP